MEYRLNKIDTDLRQKINDAAKEGIVHSTKNILVNKDKQQEKNKHPILEYNVKNEKIIVDAVKVDKVEVDIFKDKTDVDYIAKGIYLDIKK